MSASATMSTFNQPVVRRHRWLRRLAWFGAALLACFVLYLTVAVPWMNRWGATDAEIAASLPGDELVPVAGAVTNRAVTVNAAPEAIYPWIVQLGVDRGGMYSVLFVENLMGLHVTNADTIHPEWQTLAVGDFVRFTPKEYVLNPGPGLWVREMEAPNALVFCFGLETINPEPCTMTWQFVLDPQADGSTRLLLRSRTAASGNALLDAAGQVAVGPVFIMEQRMLETLKQRAESLATQQ